LANGSISTSNVQTFKIEQAIKLLPRFIEQNVEEYLIGFEKVAELNNWPRDRYASVLHAMLVG